MGRPARLACTILVVLVLVCGTVTAFDGFNGLPRPSGMPDVPTSTYGPNPKVKYENKFAACTWYGWENIHYLAVGTTNCSTQLWQALSEGPNPGSAFTYYIPQEPEFYDSEFDEYLCTIGCFDLSRASSPSATPDGPVSAPVESPAADPPVTEPPSPTPTTPAPVSIGIPPPATVAPPTASPLSPPPPAITPPPPAALFRPPPPAVALPPPTIVAPGGSTPSPVAAPGPGFAAVGVGSVMKPSSGSTFFVLVVAFLSIALHLLSAC